jgi:hypothetical protein
MNEAELLGILARGEDSRHQFKRDFTNIEALAAELIAFANSVGGRLFIGVSDGSGIPRAIEAWPDIDLIDDRRGNQFKVVIHRLGWKQAPLSLWRCLFHRPAERSEMGSTTRAG